MPAPTSDARLHLMLRAADEELIRHAAALEGRSVSEFVATSVIERAQAVLTDQREFALDEAAWIAFIELLDQPLRPDPRLVELFDRPQRIIR